MLSPSGTPSQSTDYVSGFRYEDQLLREAQHGEGRVFLHCAAQGAAGTIKAAKALFDSRRLNRCRICSNR